MALTLFEAQDVVIGSIRSMTGQTVGPEGTLASGSIKDKARARTLKTVIVADPDVGVGKFQHRLEPAALGALAPDDVVNDVAVRVRDQAFPLASPAGVTRTAARASAAKSAPGRIRRVKKRGPRAKAPTRASKPAKER